MDGRKAVSLSTHADNMWTCKELPTGGSENCTPVTGKSLASGCRKCMNASARSPTRASRSGMSQKHGKSCTRHLRKPSHGKKERLTSGHHKITETASPMATLASIPRLPEKKGRKKIPGGEWGPMIEAVMEQPNVPKIVQDGLPMNKAKTAYSAFKKVDGMTVSRCSDPEVLAEFSRYVGEDLRPHAVFAQYDTPQEADQ